MLSINTTLLICFSSSIDSSFIYLASSPGNKRTTSSGGSAKAGTSVVYKISTSSGATTLAGMIEDLLTFSLGWLITVTFIGKRILGVSFTIDIMQWQQ